MIVSPGYCVTCEKPIHTSCPTCGSKKFSKEFSEVIVKWSNGSQMPIGVCHECSTGNKWNTEEGKKGIAQAHFEYWDKTGGAYDKEMYLV